MRDLDETDLDILRLLVADGRRSYRDIATEVGLTPPTVSDRVDRLRDLGVIKRFTVDVDRSLLRDGTPVLLHLDVAPARTEAVRESLAAAAGVDHVFVTADARVTAYVSLPTPDARAWLDDVVDLDAVRSFDVDMVAHAEWSADVSGAEFALTCVECGNTVTDEGVTTTVDGDPKHFCCPSCETRYVERYEELATD